MTYDFDRLSFMQTGTRSKVTPNGMILALGCLMAIASGAEAQLQVSELAGDWTYSEISVPKDITETYFNVNTEQNRTSNSSSDFAKVGEIFVDTFFRADFEVFSGGINVASGGQVTGAESGQLSVGRGVYADLALSDDRIRFLVSSGKDVMARGSTSNDDY